MILQFLKNIKNTKAHTLDSKIKNIDCVLALLIAI